MKTKEELTEIKERIDSLSKELMALTEEELTEVLGGTGDPGSWMVTLHSAVGESNAVID